MDLTEHVEHFWWRILQDALAEATAGYWDRRAKTFAKVGTPAATETALACRRHAWLLRDTRIDAETQDAIRHAMRQQRQEPA